MSTVRQIYELLRWEVKLEWRDKYALGSVFLYVVATVVIVYLALGDAIAGQTFNALYWVVLFFGATVAAGRSFLREGGRRHLYYYTLADPLALLFSKLFYNVLVIWLISLLTFGLLSLFASAVVVTHPLPFLLAVVFGGFGLATILTFISALAARAGGNGTLMAILSFPLIVPLLKLMVDAGTYGIGEGINDPFQAVYLTLAVDLLAVAVAVVLFPFVWRD
ncbi:heme exporter protein B [Lewinella aquimaris]|uniref:Heme exporter protein B n=1 Tax=Neolewinella aquimaris TaxID=1835722 RepID=A0A840E3B9_9BACT|nr:heme exporter protein CcmB [Neolewinella aquimaris]MBB4078232.1 heme exporter protein B [Neolewinella aquimaris]